MQTLVLHRTVQARIIGFREHIFTGSHGAVGLLQLRAVAARTTCVPPVNFGVEGAAMADAEWTFGTICQRFLAGLGARMHYGSLCGKRASQTGGVPAFSLKLL